MSDENKLAELEDELCTYVRAWVQRMQPRIENDTDYAMLEITICQPQWDEDNTPVLNACIEEKAVAFELAGRVSASKKH